MQLTIGYAAFDTTVCLTLRRATTAGAGVYPFIANRLKRTSSHRKKFLHYHSHVIEGFHFSTYPFAVLKSPERGGCFQPFSGFSFFWDL